MDNLTHTLIGALVAETAARVVPTVKSTLPEQTRRNLYLGLLVLGSNLPDLDFVYTGITGGKLGYLLHHRGHTHTVLGALALAALMFAICRAWLQRRRLVPSPSDQRWLACMALLAPLLHLAMDAANSYGVHPFWPFDNSWLYGDALFIIEPLFWAAAAPLVFLLRNRVARAGMLLVLLAGLALSFNSGLVPPVMALGLTLLTVLMLLLGWRTRERTAAVTGLAVMLGVLGMFVIGKHSAGSRIETLVSALFPQATLHDWILTPMPVNPVCWEAMLVQVDGDRYTLRRAVLTLAPQWLPAAQCPNRSLNVPTTAALTPVPASDSAALQWYGEIDISLRELQTLVQTHCEAAAFTGFARALWIMRRNDKWLVGDLRYDREPGLAFAELELQSTPPSCPRRLPPWTAPRSDVL